MYTPHNTTSLRRRNAWRLVYLTLLFSILPGCLALAGYGNELEQTDVKLDTPFELAFDSVKGKSHLWLIYDVAFAGSDFTISGNFEAAIDDGEGERWTLRLGQDDPPILGTSSRTEIGSIRMTMNDRSSASGTVWLVNLDKVSPGQHVVVTGRWTAGSAMDVETLRLVATE